MSKMSFPMNPAIFSYLVSHVFSLLRAQAKSTFDTIYILGMQWLAVFSAAPNLVCAAISSLQVA